MNQATQDFIRQHQDEDVRKLAFLGSKYPEVDMPFALDQIRGRKMARTKLPRWASIDGIIYPPHISMEQCSSEQTALYKAELAARLLGLGSAFPLNVEKGKEFGNSEICEFVTKDAVASKFAQNKASREKQQILTETASDVNEAEFVDLTGGFGVDFSYIAARLGVKSMYVERQAHLCEAAKENFGRLGLKNAIVKNGNGVEMLHSLGLSNDQSLSSVRATSRLKLIFIDPARRDDAGNKVVSLQDCTPDVTILQDEMLEKADFVIIKLSPMLDWHRAVSELKHVREVHIVSTGNECKELLLVLSAHEEASLRIFCVNDNRSLDFYESDEAAISIAKADEVEGYLYEPNASLMKAGCFGAICKRYGVKMLAKNSHLFSSQELVADFPGRTFRIKAISSFNKKELKRQLAGIVKANVATRNFPLSVPELRKRLKLKDGGDNYIFATTLSTAEHLLFICKKVSFAKEDEPFL